MSKKIIICHGTTSRPERSWFPWLAWKCTQAGLDAYVPRLPTPKEQSYDSWKTSFYSTIAALDQDTILIGHSTGAPFVLRLLQEYDAKKTIKACFLVSSFVRRLNIPEHRDFEPLLYSFVDNDWDWRKLKNSAKHFKCYHGSNDNIVDLSEGEFVAKNLNCELQIIEQGKHLNTDAGFLSFPEILTDIMGIHESSTI